MGSQLGIISKPTHFTKMRGIVLAVVAFAAVNAKDDFCFSHAKSKCTEPGENWRAGACNSKHGGFEGDTSILHRMVVDDFTDSMTYLLMGSRFSTDVQNKMGFHKYFMDKSDSMWNRGKDMMKYILKRGGQMGSSFMVAMNETSKLDFTNEIKSFAVSLDLMKSRAKDIILASEHANRKSPMADPKFSYDPATSHVLDELAEDYSGEIRDVAEKLNTLARMVKKDNSVNLGVHLFDKMLKG